MGDQSPSQDIDLKVAGAGWEDFNTISTFSFLSYTGMSLIFSSKYGASDTLYWFNNADSYTEITASDNGWRAVRYYIETEEDVELSQASVQALTSEMQQYIARYQCLQGQQAKLQQEYDQGIQAMMARG